jgi:putative copper export protein
VTGGVTAFLTCPAIDDLSTAAYGQVLLLKTAPFASVAAVGFLNWQRVRPRLDHAGGAEVLRRTAAAELALAALVLAATATPVGLPQPGN